jgi:iron complex transport system substrate-binding protein
MQFLPFSILFLLSLLTHSVAQAEISVRDDSGATLKLSAPARRIVSLAPHITENLYAAGAGKYIVGVSEFSDYPPAAKHLAHVSNYAGFDLEAILAQRPDLVIVWEGGSTAAQLARLKALGLPLFVSQPRKIEDIPGNIERFGELAATGDIAMSAARAFRTRHAQLRDRYSKRPLVRTFYQIWHQPLATVNGEQLISSVMQLCGAENIFSNLPLLAPTVTLEAVLAANPEAIVASGMDESRPEWLDMWRRWKDLTANARGNLFFIPPDLINRHTPRVLDGAQMLCDHLENVRSRRK